MVDGEYYEKQIKPCSYSLKELISRYFGELFYPEKIIYFTAKLCEEKKKELVNIKNLEINEKGYIIVNKKNSRQQKGVDGYIIRELVELGYRDDVGTVALLSGDGDMKAGVESFYEKKHKKVKLLVLEATVAKELEEFCDSCFLPKLNEDTIINEEVVEKEKIVSLESLGDVIEENSNSLPYKAYITEDNFQKLKEINSFIEKKNQSLTMSFIGQNTKKYGFKYKAKHLLHVLKEFEEKGMLKLEKMKNKPDYYVEILAK